MRRELVTPPRIPLRTLPSGFWIDRRHAIGPESSQNPEPRTGPSNCAGSLARPCEPGVELDPIPGRSGSIRHAPSAWTLFAEWGVRSFSGVTANHGASGILRPKPHPSFHCSDPLDALPTATSQDHSLTPDSVLTLVKTEKMTKAKPDFRTGPQAMQSVSRRGPHALSPAALHNLMQAVGTRTTPVSAHQDSRFPSFSPSKAPATPSIRCHKCHAELGRQRRCPSTPPSPQLRRLGLSHQQNAALRHW